MIIGASVAERGRGERGSFVGVGVAVGVASERGGRRGRRGVGVPPPGSRLAVLVTGRGRIVTVR